MSAVIWAGRWCWKRWSGRRTGWAASLKAWSRAGTLWAEVVPGTGRELVREEVTGRPCRCGSRFGGPGRGAVAARLRATDSGRGRSYRIVAVTERDPGARYLICFAQEEVPA